MGKKLFTILKLDRNILSICLFRPMIRFFFCHLKILFFLQINTVHADDMLHSVISYLDLHCVSMC